MAAGDVTLFNQFKPNLGAKLLDLSADTIKVGLVTSGVTPVATTTDPRWGAGGSTNLSSNEVTPGGNYSAGGPTITATWTGTATVTFDATDVSIAQNASNPTNGRWAIIYDSTDAGKRCIGFVDLGAVIDLTAGNFSIVWNASGIFTLT